MLSIQIFGELEIVQILQIRKLPLLFSHKLYHLLSKNCFLFRNILTAERNANAQLPGKYDGYASCPLFVGGGKLLLAEFKYGGIVDETFYHNQ